MSQRIKRAEKRNEFKICKSYLASLECSHSKDDSTSKIKSVSHSSGDQEISYKNSYKSKNCNAKKIFKSPLVVRKETDSNDSHCHGLRRSPNSFSKHKRKHRYEDHFVTCKGSRKEKPSCHKMCHSFDKNKSDSESSREKKSRTFKCEGLRRFSLKDVNGLSDRYSPCNSFNSERKKKNPPNRSARCNSVNNNIRRNQIKNQDDQNENEEIIKESIEGSARTRGFKLKKEEDMQSIQSRKDINCTKLFDEENFLKSYKKSTVNLNFDNHDSCESRKGKKCISSTTNQLKKKSKSQSKKEKNVENSSKQSSKTKLDKNKKTERNNNDEENKFTDRKTDQVLKSISSPTTELSFKTRVSQESSRQSSTDRQKKLKINEEIQNSISITFNSENDASEEGKVQTVISVSEMKIEDKNRRMLEEIKKSKNKKRKGIRYKDSRRQFKRRTLRYLIYLIRKIILSNREKNKNKDRDKKFQISKENSCIRIKLENESESSSGSSGYDSLQNIQYQHSEINKIEYSEKKLSNEIEILDSEKYCIYKIYKGIDGAILLKESQNQKFKKDEYIIGKRIFKEPERLRPLLKNTISDKNINQSFSQRNNSTQTEVNLILRPNLRKKRWLKKSSIKKSQDRSKKYFFSLESTRNTSFPESSDFEHCKIPFRKTKKMYYSPSSKKSLSNFAKSSAHFLKNFTAVDTSDLNYFMPVKIPEDKMVFLFANSGNEKNLKRLDLKNDDRHLNLDTTNLSDKKTLEKEVRSTIFEKESLENFPSPVSPMIPIFRMKLHNSEFIAQKINMEEMIRVQMKNTYNFIQPAKIHIKKPDLIYEVGSSQDTRLREQTKSFKKFFGIIKRKKNDKIKFKEKLKNVVEE